LKNTQPKVAKLLFWIGSTTSMIGRLKEKSQCRLRRASFGNFGDCKGLKGAKGLWEMREHYGGGYRLYYCMREHTMVLLLAGSTKKDQSKAITKAKDYLEDYERRERHDEKSQ
jgi:putative addiction module killer protein